jgi:transposase
MLSAVLVVTVMNQLMPASLRLSPQRSRYPLWTNSEDLTDRQHAKLAWIATTDPKLYRA